MTAVPPHPQHSPRRNDSDPSSSTSSSIASSPSPPSTAGSSSTASTSATSKTGPSKRASPWIPAGADAWPIEKILLALCASTLLTNAERSTLCAFLDEYHQQLTVEARAPSNGLRPNFAWEFVKRMFDQNDPTHLAGRSFFSDADRHREWAPPPYSQVDKKNHCASMPVYRAEEQRQRQRASSLETTRKLEQGPSENASPRRGAKRLVSGTASGSSSPIKKPRSAVEVVELGDEAYGMCA
ncbi:hypothetical protein EYC84_003255 [Monilinia fructicola]|uniref:Uncharacterized protein n=1 Tax=Monilinia fructicola TaxID=38448 RepID=A0A5M9JTY3_MONFR|nr:hypothetical protein EYC84_003255 [Monilinia fructicola]